jgi:hypothetical protein
VRRRACAGGGGCATTASEPDAASTSAPVVDGKKDMPPPVVAIADDPAAPVSLTIDGVSAPTDPVATDVAGTLLPPQDVSRLGWWVDSALPGGGSGAIVVTGHVDDVDQGDGFAARFAGLREGDEITVSVGDGRTRDYRVDRVLSVGKDGDLPLPLARPNVRFGQSDGTDVTFGRAARFTELRDGRTKILGAGVRARDLSPGTVREMRWRRGGSGPGRPRRSHRWFRPRPRRRSSRLPRVIAR